MADGPEKPPRKTPVPGVRITTAAEERDKYPRKTPPAGVLEQIAPSGTDSWEDQSGGGTASTGVVAKPLNVPETKLDKIERRSGETKNMLAETIGPAVDATSKVVDSTAVKVDQLESRMDSIFPVLGDLRGAVARQDNQNLAIISLLLKERDSQIKTTEIAHLTDNEIRKAREFSLIKSSEADRDARREVIKKFALQIIVGLTVAAGIAATAFQAGRC